MDFIIKDMTELNEDGLTYNCLLELNGEELLLTLPADTVSLNDISSVLYYEYYNDEWVSTLGSLKEMLPETGDKQLQYIYENKGYWLQQLKLVMNEEEMKEYFESYDEEEEDYGYLDYIDSPEHHEFLESLMKDKV